MLSYLRNLLMYLVLIVSTSSAIAQVIEIKLDCQISSIKKYSLGISEKQQLSELVEILQHANTLSITPASYNVPSVSTASVSGGFMVFNLSDPNKWDLAIEKTDERRQLIIDRNTGKLFFSSYFKAPNGVSVQSEGNGFCRKVETGNKLF